MTDGQQHGDEPAPFTEGASAEAWFYGLRGGGTILDAHLVAIHSVFGSEVQYSLRAAVNRWTGRPVQLFIEIDRPSDDEEAFQLLIEVQRLLLAEADAIAERSARRRPFANVAVTLARPPRDWDGDPIAREVES